MEEKLVCEICNLELHEDENTICEICEENLGD